MLLPKIFGLLLLEHVILAFARMRGLACSFPQLRVHKHFAEGELPIVFSHIIEWTSEIPHTHLSRIEEAFSFLFNLSFYCDSVRDSVGIISLFGRPRILLARYLLKIFFSAAQARSLYSVLYALNKFISTWSFSATLFIRRIFALCILFAWIHLRL